LGLNNKAQQGIVGFIFLILVFLILFGIWLGGFVNQLTHQAVIDANLTGIEAFLYDNLSLFILLALLLGIITWFAFGGSG